jgi:GNAT superfamily N-acetyltransferase
MKRPTIEPMIEPDIEDAVELITVAMNRDEARWARETMEFYFACKKQDIDSGREYYLWRHQGKIQGLVGLHRYLWGPRENVWLAWFAVHPQLHRAGVGSAMLDEVEERARQSGYRKFLIETYDSPTFEKALSFYKSKGFSQVGKIDNYLPDGSAMLVFGKEL